jgi:restriction system protein
MARRRRHQQEPVITLLVLFAIAAVALYGSDASKAEHIVFLLIGVGMLLAVVILSVVLWIEIHRRHALRALDRARVDQMDGVSFERYVGTLLKTQGYRGIQYTKTSGDFGVDIIIKKKGVRTAVQVKRSKAPISGSAVQQAVAGMNYYKCTQSMVVTNASFTSGAKTLAASNKCVLIDGIRLGSWAEKLQK